MEKKIPNKPNMLPNNALKKDIKIQPNPIKKAFQIEITETYVGEITKSFKPSKQAQGSKLSEELINCKPHHYDINHKSHNKRQLVKDPTLFPYSCIGYLCVKFPGINQRYFSTGSFIGPNYVLTCAHNVYDRELQLEAELVYFVAGMFGKTGIPIKVIKVYYGEEYRKIKSNKLASYHDYAILELQKADFSEVYGYFGLNYGQIHQSTNILIYGYQNFQSQQKYIVGQSTTLEKIQTQKQGKFLKYAIDSLGQSGSPIFIKNKEEYRIVGLHLEQTPKYRTGLKLSPLIINTINKWISTKIPKLIINYKIKDTELETGLSQYTDSLSVLSIDTQDYNKPFILKNQGLQMISRFKWAKLTKIHLKNNQISKIPPLKIPTLLHLSITKNMITSIENIDELSQLTYLSLEDNKIQKIENLQNLFNLTELILVINQIRKIQNLNNLHSLRKILLWDNKITKIENLSLPKLQTLALSYNNIQKIQNLQKLSSLTDFSACYTKITNIQNLEHLQNLQILALSDNKIEKIQNLDQLVNLKFLYLNRNMITRIQNLDKIKGLNQLHLIYNKIERIQNLQNQTQLKLLNLQGNQIKKMENLDRLGNLIQLLLQFNLISKIQNIDNLKSLTRLAIGDNKIVRNNQTKTFYAKLAKRGLHIQD